MKTSPKTVRAVRDLLRSLGHDVDREGLQATPGRVARMFAELHDQKPFDFTVFDAEGADEMVVVAPIPFHSLCEHHMLPFFGTAAVAYIPDGKIVGLSKLPRAVEYCATGLQNQERITRTVGEMVITTKGWRYKDQTMLIKLTASLRKFGQLRPVIVRTENNARYVVRGNQIVEAMRAAGLEKAWVVDVGSITEQETIALALALEIGFDVDYAALAGRVAFLVNGGVSPVEVSGLSPFVAARIESFCALAAPFDWSVFDQKDDGQGGFLFGDDIVTTEIPDGSLETPDSVVTIEPVQVEPLKQINKPLPVNTPVVLPGQSSLFS